MVESYGSQIIKGGLDLSKIFVIANPSSGQGQAKNLTAYINDQYLKLDIKPMIHITKNQEDIIKYAHQAAENQADKVFLIGGDGTISIYMNAIKDLAYRAELAIIPTGTLNNVARALKIPLDPREAVNQLIDGTPYMADMGLINGKVFTSTISAGRIPESAWQVSKEEKDQYGNLAYLIGGLKSLNKKDVYKYKIKIDGQTYTRKLDLLVIGVSNSIIGYTEFFQKASYYDNKLHLFALENAGVMEKTLELSKLLMDQETYDRTKEDKSFTRDFTEIEIDLINDSAHVTVDGEKGPEFPISIKVLPKFINLTVPRQQS